MRPAARFVGPPGLGSELAHLACELFWGTSVGADREASPSEPLLADLPAFFAANQLAFLSLPQSAATARLLERAVVVEALRRESDRFARLRAEFEVVRAAWREEGIEAILVKAGAGVPSFPHLSGNVDAYVPPEAAEVADAVLCRHGFVELPLLREPNKFLYKRFRHGDEACAIHLHLRVEWCASFLREDLMWSRRRVAPDDSRLLIPSPEDALLITLAHALYENKRLALGDLFKVGRCLRGPEFDWQYVWAVAESKGWGTGLAHALLFYRFLACSLAHLTELPEPEVTRCRRRLAGPRRLWARRKPSQPNRLPFPVGFFFSKTLFFGKVLGDSGEPWRERLRGAVYHLLSGTRLKLRLEARRHFLVAFSGIDGSGKTSLARSVQRALRQCGIRTRCVWHRAGSSGLSRVLIAGGKLLVATRAPGVRAEVEAPAAREARRVELLRHPLVRALWQWLVLLELTWTYARKVRLPLILGKVVLCDRYTADAVADLGSRLGGEAPADTLPARLLRALNPTPDVAIYVCVPPEVARRRQAPEARQGTPELAERQAAVLGSIASGGGWTRVDGRPPLGQVVDRVVHDVLRRYASACRQPLRGLLRSGFEPSRCEGDPPLVLAPPPVPMPFGAPKVTPEARDRG